MSIDFKGLREWRCIGPFRGGRVVTVAADYHCPNVFYFGAVAGGVWKTSDAGTYWECISDGFFTTASIGALEVAPSDSQVIYAGTGETTIRIDVSHGDGVYKSTDAGRTWTHLGLRETRHIGKIRVHPDNPAIVYVAALGHAFGPNPERGVYKSIDGGHTWRLVLHKSANAGAVDLSIDRTNPRILYAAIWQATRSFWQISSGGSDSGLWQSTDGGETWVDISDRPGLPKGIKGKIGIATSPARAGRVWALIEHAHAGGLYRSDDAGATWERVSDFSHLLSRAWYYTHLTADPCDSETIYVNNLSLWRSNDGGKTFVEIATPHGDNHDLWIDPRNPQRMIQANDGGATVSLNGGVTWSTIYNQPTAQFYHIATDTRSPYYVYGTQQDNTSIAVPSRSPHAAILWNDCFDAGTGESGYITVRPDDPNIVYVGAIGSSLGGGNCLQRYDHRTRQIRMITTWPEDMSGHGAADYAQRFAWTYPIVISPHDPHTLYVAGNILLRSTDEGQHWTPISPDLTRADPQTLQPSGGPINRDAVGAEIYATIFAFAESPHEPGVLWAGSDDGLLHLSRDGGQHWTNITPPDMEAWTLISCIELSPYDRACAYVAATRYKHDDYRPYLYKTEDYGATWQRIDSGIEADAFTRIIRADPVRRGLLFAGTETGLYLSYNDGASWQHFQLNLPIAPLHDLLIHGDDLIAGTHGRSIWILDDIGPLRQYEDTISNAEAHLFQPRPSIRTMPQIDWTSNLPGKNYLAGFSGAFISTKQPDGTTTTKYLDVGQNPPAGVIVTYYLQQTPQDIITLTFTDQHNSVIRTISSRAIEPAPDTKPRDTLAQETETKEAKLPAQAGWNRFIWNMRHPNIAKLEGNDPIAEDPLLGPFVAPGRYHVTLTVGTQHDTQPFEIVKYPTATATQAELDEQYDLMLRIYQATDRAIGALNRMRDMRQQLDGWSKRAARLPEGHVIAATAATLHERILAIEKTILVPNLRPGWTDSHNTGTRLLNKLIGLQSVVECGDHRPTEAAHAVFAALTAQLDATIAQFDTLIASEIPTLNTHIANAHLGAIVARP